MSSFWDATANERKELGKPRAVKPPGRFDEGAETKTDCEALAAC